MNVGIRHLPGALRGSRLAPIPLHVRLRARRLGFSGWSALWYDLERNDPSDYLPDVAMGRLKKVNGAATRAMMRNKLLCATTFARHVPMPRLAALIDGGRVTALEGAGPSSPAELAALAADLGGLILKPMADSTGRGVYLLESDGERTLVDGRELDRQAYLAFIARLDGVLACERVRSAPYSAAIFPGSVNTLRIVSIRDVETGRGHVVVASHRFGTSASAPTDNGGRGGISGGVDLPSGRMRMVTDLKTMRDGRLVEHAAHPETGARIEGVVVPRFGEVLDLIRDAFDAMPFLHFCGWDFAIGEAGPVVIEANDGPALVTQRYRPYLTDPHMRRFLEHHGVIGAGATAAVRRAGSRRAAAGHAPR